MKSATITCPNDPNHKTFSTKVHVTEKWIVNNRAEFIKIAERTLDGDEGQSEEDDILICETCGAVSTYRKGVTNNAER